MLVGQRFWQANAEASAASAEEDAALAVQAVANVIQYVPVPEVTLIPSNPDDGDAIEVDDSTGIESFSPLSGLPEDFVGDSASSVQLIYRVDTWVYIRYLVKDPESRYVPRGSNVSELVNDAEYISEAPQDGGAVRARGTWT